MPMPAVLGAPSEQESAAWKTGSSDGSKNGWDCPPAAAAELKASPRQMEMDALREMKGELENEEKRKKELEDELKDAEAWAEDMQEEWDVLEKKWKSEIAALRKRCEDSSKSIGDQGESPLCADPKELEHLRRQLKDIGKGVEDAKARAQQVDASLEEAQRRSENLTESLKEATEKMEATAGEKEKAEARVKNAEVALKEHEEATSQAQQELKLAAKWADDTMAGFTAEIQEKDSVLQEKQAEVEKLRADLKGQGVEEDKPVQRAPTTITADDLEALEQRISAAKESGAAHRRRADAAAESDSAAKKEAESSTQEVGETTKEELLRSKALQQELEEKNRELKRLKGQVDAQTKAKAKEGAALKDLETAQAEVEAQKQSLQDAQEQLAVARKKLTDLLTLGMQEMAGGKTLKAVGNPNTSSDHAPKAESETKERKSPSSGKVAEEEKQRDEKERVAPSHDSGKPSRAPEPQAPKKIAKDEEPPPPKSENGKLSKRKGQAASAPKAPASAQMSAEEKARKAGQAARARTTSMTNAQIGVWAFGLVLLVQAVMLVAQTLRE